MIKNYFRISILFSFLFNFLVAQVPPTANNDNDTTFINTTLTKVSPGLLENDTDADNDVLTVTDFLIGGLTFNAGQTASFAEGSITISADGSYTFNPALNFEGDVPLINYTITDGTFTSSADLNLSVVVNPRQPIANNDNNTTFRNVTLNEASPGVLANDTDPDNDVLTVTDFLIGGLTFNAGQTAAFAEGSITISANGSYTFNPALNFEGVVPSINYTVTDGAFTSSASLNIAVFLSPNPPIANDNTNNTFQNTPLNVVSPGVLDNDTDPDNDVLTVAEFLINGATFNAGQTASFAEGSITIFLDGSYNFTPIPNYTGNVTLINYTITDGSFTSSANLNLSVIYPPTPPVANDDYDTADENSTLNVSAAGVLENDTDLNEDVLSITEFLINGITYSFGQTANLAEGDFTLFQDGSYTLVAAPNYIGEVPVINYTITDGTFISSANLFLTIEPTENLIEILSLTSCNQGFTSSNFYKIRYGVVLRNRSNAKDFHPSSLIKNIDLVNDLQATFGSGCIVTVDQISIQNDNFTNDFSGQPYPKEFNNNAINLNFVNGTSTSFFSEEAINNFTLYPRQSIFISYCVTVRAFCDGRPNPTPSGSDINFTNTLNVSDSSGASTNSITLRDFHSTEAVVSAALNVPEFNNNVQNPPGTANSNGSYDFVNTLIITNEGAAAASNVNFNMGLRDFISKGITFNDIRITQVAGPNVTINTAYNGITETNLLTNNNTLPGGETIRLEIYYLIAPISNSRYSYFYQMDKSQTQGPIDDFDETLEINKNIRSFVKWSDGLGDHVDSYYFAGAPTSSVSADSQCSCITLGMRFVFDSSSRTTKIISDSKPIPNGILEHEEVTFQITITNTSESVQLEDLQLADNLSNICTGKLVSVGTPFIQSSTATSNPILNLSFNGTSDTNIFNGTSGLLMANESITVQFSAVFSENCSATNTALFTAKDPLNNTVSSSNSVTINVFTDTDNDGISNVLDIDDDNDTIPDVLEYNGLNPLDDDDADLIPNYRDTDFGADRNGDGIVDIFDFDNDGVANHLDLDSDNDGILDIIEAGNSIADTNNNGRTNNTVGANGLDNTLENNDTTNATINYVVPNTDSTGNPNYVDIDADGDGIVDNIEAQLTSNYITLNGVVSEDGIDSAYPNGLIPIDSENDGIPDYIDTNSDNDIRDDSIEGWDTNTDGTPETIAINIDIDNDGLDDAFDTNTNLVNPTNGQTPLSFPNADNTDTPERDWREIIAILIQIDNITETESNDFVFTFTLVTKNDNSVFITSASPIDFNLSTINGTDTTAIFDVATSPFDFSGFTNTTFTIPPFTNSAQFTVSSLEDTIFEITELFTLNATVTSNNTLNTEVNAIGTILDNDAAPSITMNNSREDEGVDLMHTIVLSNPCSTPIIIDVNTSDDLAISPQDYTSYSETLTINGTIDPNNTNTQVSFSITSLLDNLNELDEETLNVTGTVTTTNIGLQDLTKTATIVDVDPNPLISIEDVTVEEGNTMLFTIRLLNANLNPMQNYLPINLVLETIDQTTTANQDYESIALLASIPALSSEINQSIKTLDDSINEDTETFLFRATTNLGNISNAVQPSAIGTIKDNDYPNLFSPNSDGRSDVFKIGGIEEFPNFKLVIFNRQGNEVYNYSNNGRTNPIWWDGTYNGNPVPVGVYYYTLDFNDGVTKPRTNFIQLIR
ncbi:MAG: cadherin-like domain-containing protein [Polaribacter sp.]|uniref:cadherin-like domain-containing protein n=1 Tax=Polaribacter sp. TaxID=1920175 RepID=UPI003BAE29FD